MTNTIKAEEKMHVSYAEERDARLTLERIQRRKELYYEKRLIEKSMFYRFVNRSLPRARETTAPILLTPAEEMRLQALDKELLQLTPASRNKKRGLARKMMKAWANTRALFRD